MWGRRSGSRRPRPQPRRRRGLKPPSGRRCRRIPGVGDGHRQSGRGGGGGGPVGGGPSRGGCDAVRVHEDRVAAGTGSRCRRGRPVSSISTAVGPDRSGPLGAAVLRRPDPGPAGASAGPSLTADGHRRAVRAMTVVIGGAVRRRSGLGTAVAVVALLLSGCVSYDPNPTVVIDNRTDREVLYQTDMPDSTADGRRPCAAGRSATARVTVDQGAGPPDWLDQDLGAVEGGPGRTREDRAAAGRSIRRRSGRPVPSVTTGDGSRRRSRDGAKHRLHLVEDGGWKVGAAEC